MPTREGSPEREALNQYNVALNSILLIESLLLFCGLYIRLRIEAAYFREINVFGEFMSCGFLDVVVILFCLGFGLSEVGLWLSLVRLILMANLIFENFPHLSVLMVSDEISTRSNCRKENDRTNPGSPKIINIVFFICRVVWPMG